MADRSTDDSPQLGFDTLAVHAGAEPDELTGAVSPPIYQTSTYAQDGVGRPRRGYEYARSQNPTRERLERAVAALEGGEHGIAFASGSAATAAIAELAGPGDEIVVGDDVYGGTFRYLEQVRRGAGVDARYVDLASGQDALWEALSERTRLVWFETPSNPHLKVVDIVATVATVARRGAEGGGRPLVVVDNTFASPALQRPLLDGADIVFHSATKYLAGHSDTILGVAVTSDPARRGPAAIPAERDGRRARSARLLPGPARVAHAAPAHGTPRRECRDRARSTSVAGPMSRARLLPGDAAGWSRSCPTRRRPARSDRGRTGRGDRRGDPPVHPGRIAGRGRIADRDPGRDDPHVGRRVAPRGLAGTGPAVGRDRGPAISSPTWPRRSTGPEPGVEPATVQRSRRSAPTRGRPARVGRRPRAGA